MGRFIGKRGDIQPLAVEALERRGEGLGRYTAIGRGRRCIAGRYTDIGFEKPFAGIYDARHTWEGFLAIARTFFGN